MIKVKIIALGKLKEKYWRDAIAEYSKRMGAFANFEITELAPKALPDNPAEAQIEAALLSEAEMIIKAIPKTTTVVALCIEGKMYSSEDLAKEIALASQNSGSITFIIGSSYGLHEKIKNLANVKMSMSKMTFPHQLARVVLSEQIYRAFKINEGSAYHK